jgi:ferrous iron transport protein B
MVIWFLGYFPNHDAYDSVQEQQEHSFIGYIGKSMEPVLEPLGFDWRMGVGIVAGVGAKELVVSTLGVMYAPEEPVATAPTDDSTEEIVEDAANENVSETAGETRLQKALQRSITPAAALAYMVFILLYFPCIATFIAIRRESGSWKWAILTAVYTIILAWIAAFITFHIAMLFGL